MFLPDALALFFGIAGIDVLAHALVLFVFIAALFLIPIFV
jgi:hypothetical protein